MKKNMGQTDKVIRVLAALLFAVLYFSGIVTGTSGIILLVIAIVFLLTSLMSYCPIYTLLGICTNKNAPKTNK